MSRKKTYEFRYIISPHLDLFWLGTHKTCLERGATIIRDYIDICRDNPEYKLLIESVVFADYFMERYPDYQQILRTLIENNRVEIGACYVDRWENIILGESLIRQIVFGQRWNLKKMGHYASTAVHPDLPGVVSQIAQIYSGAHVKAYITSRKACRYGGILRFRSPNGSKLMFIYYPGNPKIPGYCFRPISEWLPELEDIAQNFPNGIIALAGGAGDLAGPETFIKKFEHPLAEIISKARAKYPEHKWNYSIPSEIYESYNNTTLPETSGEIPSVWGVPCDESMEVMCLDRLVENALLTAETLAAINKSVKKKSHLPVNHEEWYGVFHDIAFFGRKDIIILGTEWQELWRLQLFSQDHNGGSIEGLESTFQKKQMKMRALQYSSEIVDYCLEQINDGSGFSSNNYAVQVFNPLNWERTAVVETLLPEPLQKYNFFVAHNEYGKSTPVQISHDEQGQVWANFIASSIPSVGIGTWQLEGSGNESTCSISIEENAKEIKLTSKAMEVIIDKMCGEIVRLHDRRTGQILDGFGHHWGAIYALFEEGTDVALRFVPNMPLEKSLVHDVCIKEVGPVYVKVQINRELVQSKFVQEIILFADLPRLDLKTTAYWWGKENLQIRQVLPHPIDLQEIHFASPFYACNWNEIMPGAGTTVHLDEVLPEDWSKYREIHGWIHLMGEKESLTIASTYPVFYWDNVELAAVLLRSAANCGDTRLCWNNAGEHTWHFSLFPAQGDWRSEYAYRNGSENLRPVVVKGTRNILPNRSFCQLTPENLVLSALKPEDGGNSLILRYYEIAGQPVDALICLSVPIAHAAKVNLLEEEISSLLVEEDTIFVPTKAYEIVTVKLTFS